MQDSTVGLVRRRRRGLTLLLYRHGRFGRPAPGPAWSYGPGGGRERAFAAGLPGRLALRARRRSSWRPWTPWTAATAWSWPRPPGRARPSWPSTPWPGRWPAGRKAFYTTPLKALSNQKFADFARRYGAARVGLLTGDNAINGDAPVVVMTTEVLRNMVYAGSESLLGLRYVVLDEVHYLQDPYRGPVWEEVIIHLAPEVDLVCLSATVSNAEELADWVGTVRGSTRAVIEERRPVPLHNLFLVGDRRREGLVLLPTFVDERAQPPGGAAITVPRADDRVAGAPPRRPVRAPPGRDGGPAGRRGLPARHLLHLQPGRLRRGRAPVHARGPPPDQRRGAAPDPPAGRGSAEPSLGRRPRRSRVRPVVERGSRPASPPTTPAWSRRSKRRSNAASPPAW